MKDVIKVSIECIDKLVNTTFTDKPEEKKDILGDI